MNQIQRCTNRTKNEYVAILKKYTKYFDDLSPGNSLKESAEISRRALDKLSEEVEFEITWKTGFYKPVINIPASHSRNGFSCKVTLSGLSGINPVLYVDYPVRREPGAGPISPLCLSQYP